MFENPLLYTAHRPYPLPPGNWAMQQVWHDLLFAHWKVSLSELRRLIPSALEIDTYAGEAWLSVVPFRMSGIHPRGTFDVPGLSAFPELNVRTYVVRDGKPGVWFFSLEAANWLAVQIARGWFHLPYFHARMRLMPAQGGIDYSSERIHAGAVPASFNATYIPFAEKVTVERGSLEEWLTERYCLYASDPHGNLYRGEIHHKPWNLQTVQVEIRQNTMSHAAGVLLPDQPPLVQFSRRLDVLVWALEKLGSGVV